MSAISHPDPESIRSPARLAALVADPTRLRLLQVLLAGPASVGELMDQLAATQSNVSNHLAVMRAAGLVRTHRVGRLAEYQIANPGVAQFVEALSVLGETPKRQRPVGELAIARTCYDHLAGKLGVHLFDALLAADAISEPRSTRADIALGPTASTAFAALGLETMPVPGQRRRFAYGCLDWTERRFHLGGALAAALAGQFFGAGWVKRTATGRALQVRGDAWRAVDRLTSAQSQPPESVDRFPPRG